MGFVQKCVILTVAFRLALCINRVAPIIRFIDLLFENFNYFNYYS